MAPGSQAFAPASRPLAGHDAGSWPGKEISILACLSPTTYAVGQRSTDPHLFVEDAQKQSGLPKAQESIMAAASFLVLCREGLSHNRGLCQKGGTPGPLLRVLVLGGLPLLLKGKDGLVPALASPPFSP